MKKNSFSKIACGIFLSVSIILSVNAAGNGGEKKGKPRNIQAGDNSSQNLEKDYERILAERNYYKGICDKFTDRFESIDTSITTMGKKINNLEAKLTSEVTQNPEKTDLSGMIIAVSCVGGVLGLLLLGSFIVLLIRTKKDKNRLTKEDLKVFNTKTQTLFAQTPQEEFVKKIVQEVPSVTAISSSVTEKLKAQFDSIRKAVSTQGGSKNESEILDKVKSIHTLVKSIDTLVNGKLAELYSNSEEVIKQQAALTSKIKDADRKAAEAQKTIDSCEADKVRAVNAAKTEMQTSMLKQFAAEKAKMNETVEQKLNAAAQQTTRIEKLTTECAELKIQYANANTSGYERGLKTAQEKTEALVRSNEHLSMELSQEREKNKNANAEFNQKLSSALAEKEKEFKQIQITSQNNMREAFEKKYNGEIERLSAALAEKTNSASLLVQQKNESDQKVRELQGQMTQAKNEIANEQKKTQDAEALARESAQKAEAMQTTVLKVQKEKESLEGTIADCKTSIEKLTGEKEIKEASLRAAEKKINELQSVIYPSEYVKDHDFSVLKEHLDGWFAEKIDAAEIIKSALGLFSQKTAVNPETWQQALRNISVGITQVMREKKQSPNAILSELVLWSKFLMKFSDENYDFSLKIPNIGDNVDPSWMSPKNNKTTKVNAVLTWAVWNNQFGVMHNAEVE